MTLPRFAWALLTATTIATSILVVRAVRNATEKEAALEHEKAHSIERNRLLDEHRRLSAGQLSEAERGQLQFKRAELAGLKGRLLTLELRAAGDDRDEDDPGAPETLPSVDWIYAGRATPRAVMQSVLWSASRGDVDHLAELLAFTDDVRTKADAIFSGLPPASQREYGSPERVVATLLAGSFPKTATAMTIVGDRAADREAEIEMRVDHSSGGPRTNSFDLRRSEDGWRLIVPASVIEGYEKTVAGEQPTSEPDTP
jgi:hypothetical protein